MLTEEPKGAPLAAPPSPASAGAVRGVLHGLAILLALGGIALLFHRSNVPYVLWYSKPYLIGLGLYAAVLVLVLLAARFASARLAGLLAIPAVQGLVLLLAGGGIALLAAESLLAVLPERFWHPAPHHREGPIFPRPDRLVHHVRPAATATTIVAPYGEYRAEVRINSDNLRDVERPLVKPAGTYRVLVLGDSLTEAVQVSLEDTFVKRLERQLAKARGGPVDVINAGIGASSPTTEYLMLKHKGIKYAPDVVVCAFSMIAVSLDWQYRPELRFDERGAPVERVVMSGGAVHDVFFSLFAYSRVLQLVVGHSARLTQPAVPPLVRSIFETEPPEVEQRQWEGTLTALREMRRYAEANGARFVLMVIPFAPQVAQEAGRELDIPEVMRTSRRPQQVLAEFAGEHGVLYLDLIPAFLAARGGGSPLFFRRDTHLTPSGHQVIATALTEFLAKR